MSSANRRVFMFAQCLRELISHLRLETFGVASRYKKTHSLGTVVRLPPSRLSKLLLASTICLEPVLAANLSIKFVDPDGKTLPKVDVRITHLITHRFEQVISDRQGKIEVAGLTDGKYELLAQLKNCFPLNEEIELTGDMLLEKVMFNQKFVDRANKEVAEAVRAVRARGGALPGAEFYGSRAFKTTDVSMVQWANPGDIELVFDIQCSETSVKWPESRRLRPERFSTCWNRTSRLPG